MEILVQLVLVLLLSGNVTGQTSTVSYSTTTVPDMLNPERGFYFPTETYLSSYAELSSALAGKPASVSLIFRIYYLDTCLHQDLPTSFLDTLSQELSLIRQRGLKVIPRFTYTSDGIAAEKDASLDMVLRHINQLKNVLTNNSDVIFLLQAGFIGVWGEWYYTTHFPSNSPGDRATVVQALLDAIPATRQVALRTPEYKQTFLGNSQPLSTADAAGNTTNEAARIGIHNDCFLMDETDSGTYRDDNDKSYASTESGVGLAFGGETCSATAVATSCSFAVSNMTRMHTTYLNVEYHPDVIASWKAGGCFETVRDRLGYRIVAQQGEFSAQSAPGKTVSFDLSIKNDGFAPLINPRDVEVVFQSVNTTLRCTASIMNINPKSWVAGSSFRVTANLKLPMSMPLGSYKLLLNLPDPELSLRDRKEYRITLANTNLPITTERLNDLQHTIDVVATASGSSANSSLINVNCGLATVVSTSTLAVATSPQSTTRTTMPPTTATTLTTKITAPPATTTKATTPVATETTPKATTKATTLATTKTTPKATTKATTPVAMKTTPKATTKATTPVATKTTPKATTKATTLATTKTTPKATTKATTTLATTKTTPKATMKVTTTLATTTTTRKTTAKTTARTTTAAIG